MVRAPGLEPGFRRWQRPVITTTLRSLGIYPTKQRYKPLSAVNLLKSKPIFKVVFVATPAH